MATVVHCLIFPTLPLALSCLSCLSYLSLFGILDASPEAESSSLKTLRSLQSWEPELPRKRDRASKQDPDLPECHAHSKTRDSTEDSGIADATLPAPIASFWPGINSRPRAAGDRGLIAVVL